MCTEDEARAHLKTLKTFNEKIERLERSGFTKRFNEDIPNVVATFSDVTIENLGGGHLTITGRIKSWVPDYNEDEVDAVLLTYRMLTQDNDRISLRNLAKLYNAEWFPKEGAEIFNSLRDRVNDCLDSIATIEFPETQITIRFLMDVIIYGGLAHSNPRKEEIFKSWMSSDAAGFFQVEFLAALRHIFSIFSELKDLNLCAIKMFERALEVPESEQKQLHVDDESVKS